MASERKCKAKRSGQYPLSPALKTVGLKLLYWKMCLCAHTGKQPRAKTIAKLEITLSISPAERALTSYQDVWIEVKAAKGNQTQAKADAAKLRDAPNDKKRRVCRH